jgi:hypothetical protein
MTAIFPFGVGIGCASKGDGLCYLFGYLFQLVKCQTVWVMLRLDNVHAKDINIEDCGLMIRAFDMTLYTSGG